MTLTFDVFTEPHGPITLEEHEGREWEKRREARIRPHCGRCGRFIRKATLRTVHSYWTPYEYDQTGECVVHGKGVPVSWQEQ